MNKVAEFFPVSKEQFEKDFLNKFPNTDLNLPQNKYVEAIGFMYEFVSIQLPQRSTKGSAGYDFVSPMTFDLEPNEELVIPTGVRCKIDDGWVLMIYPRSSLGFKYHCNLANSTAVIDSDYYYADNEGHIMIKLVNRGSKIMHIEAGDKFCQGVFLPYGITYNDSVIEERHGGIGSTGK